VTTWTGPTFLNSIVQPALIAVGLNSPPAETLVLATAIHESGEFRWNIQQNGGPALGWFQMEPQTADDVWLNVLQYQPALRDKVANLLAPGTAGNSGLRSNSALVDNDQYAAAMCRVEYYRFEAKDPRPANPNDIAAIAAYWKKHYNTASGRGNEEDFRFHWNRQMAPPAPVNKQ
jgi:hypothetical protein